MVEHLRGPAVSHLPFREFHAESKPCPLVSNCGPQLSQGCFASCLSPAEKAKRLGSLDPGGQSILCAAALFNLKLSSYHFQDRIISSAIIFHRRLGEEAAGALPAVPTRHSRERPFFFVFETNRRTKRPINTASQKEYFISLAAMRKPTCNKIEERDARKSGEKKKRRRKGRKI